MSNTSPGFVLHRQNYGETSRILRCFTRDYGRVDMVCKGCRKSKSRSGSPEPFRLYRFSWVGRHELKTLTGSDEVQHFPLHVVSEQLYCAFYVNELLSKVIRYEEADQGLFALYEATLTALQTLDTELQMVLRQFELGLLQSMGYGVELTREHDGVTPIQPALDYGYEPDQGLYPTNIPSKMLARGDSILALSKGSFLEPRHEREAKLLMRAIIQYYLPCSSIQSRKLFA